MYMHVCIYVSYNTNSINMKEVITQLFLGFFFSAACFSHSTSFPSLSYILTGSEEKLSVQCDMMIAVIS